MARCKVHGRTRMRRRMSLAGALTATAVSVLTAATAPPALAGKHERQSHNHAARTTTPIKHQR